MGREASCTSFKYIWETTWQSDSELLVSSCNTFSCSVLPLTQMHNNTNELLLLLLPVTISVCIKACARDCVHAFMPKWVLYLDYFSSIFLHHKKISRSWCLLFYFHTLSSGVFCIRITLSALWHIELPALFKRTKLKNTVPSTEGRQWQMKPPVTLLNDWVF